MDESELVARARDRDTAAFTTLTEPHRATLRLHCYRMCASYDEAEDLVQETFLRAWRAMPSFAGKSSVRTWLYRIATNASIDASARARRVLPYDLSGPWQPDEDAAPRTDLPWLQPFPNSELPADPGDAAVSRETLHLGLLAALQLLPPRQRAALIARDMLGWDARHTAELLGTSVAAANSAVQRARATLRDHLPAERLDWTTAAVPTAEEADVLRHYVAALENADIDAVADLLADEVRAAMPPLPMWYSGRDAVIKTLSMSWDPESPDYVGRLAAVLTGANAGPAVALYRQPPGQSHFSAFGIGMATVYGGRIHELVAFHDPHIFTVFDLPEVLER